MLSKAIPGERHTRTLEKSKLIQEFLIGRINYNNFIKGIYMSSISNIEKLSYSTIQITSKAQNVILGTGTGYFYRFEIEPEVIPVIVTNKHVLQDADELELVFSSLDENSNIIVDKHIKYIYKNVQQNKIEHPNMEVDLCILPISELLEELLGKGNNLRIINFDNSILLSDSEWDRLTAYEDVIMIGYPDGIWDSTNNLPIFRKGITASHPKYNWKNKLEFIIDIACFPGSSGSPIFLVGKQDFANLGGGFVVPLRIKLLGTLYAGMQHIANGEIKIIEIPAKREAIISSYIPNNLGVVIKSNRLLDFYPLLRILLNNR
ncbi:MAG: S1 family peptidase [Ignavibacteriaceae bacterium]